MTRLNSSARNFLLTCALAAAAPFGMTAPAAAQAITPGLVVVDPAGGTVGQVTAVKGDTLILKTDRHEVALPTNSFTPHEGKLLFAMTREQLNAETDKALAAAEAAMVVGAEVHGSQNGLIGHIEAIDADTVTIKLTSGEIVRLPRSGVAPAPHGAVVGVTAEELKTLAAQATGAQ